MSVFNDIQVDVKISSTAISGAITYDVTLHGAANGLRELSASVTAAFEEIEGAYTGIAQAGESETETRPSRRQRPPECRYENVPRQGRAVRLFSRTHL